MDKLNSETLLSIFKTLDSIEMVRARRVSRLWFQIIDSNKVLWRDLILPDIDGMETMASWDRRKPDGAGAGWMNAVELYDRKSCSSLRSISMIPPWVKRSAEGTISREIAQEEAMPFFNIIERSKTSLKHVHLKNGFSAVAIAFYTEILRSLPNLVELRVHRCQWGVLREPGSLLCLPIDLGKLQVGNQGPSGSSLKILSIGNEWEMMDLNLCPDLLQNLVSLSVDKMYTSSEWRQILDRPSRSLRHLAICLSTSEEEHLVPALDFPSLKILQIVIALYSDSDEIYPHWMKIPVSSTLIIDSSDSYLPLPRCSALQIIGCVTGQEQLQRRLPDLRELRTTFLRLSDCGPVVSMLKQREANVNAGLEIGGVKMRSINRIILPFCMLDRPTISKFRKLCNEVVDLATLPESLGLGI